MPLGNDDYDVVIGVNVSDRTAAGSASVRNNVNKMSDDVRKYGDRQARDFARTSRDLFNQTDQNVTKSANGMIRRLVTIFETNNFLLRNMARQAGSSTGAIGIGIAKLALSYQRLGKDTEESSHAAKVALESVKLAISGLGTDPTAFPAALKATKDLSLAYQGMGISGHAAAIKAGNALEDSVHSRVVLLQTGLLKAQRDFEKFGTGGVQESEKLRGKINDISASVKHLLGGAAVDAPFFKSFIKAKNENEKYLLVLDKLGPKAAIAYAQNQGAVEKLATSFVRLESNASRSLKSQSDKASEAATKITNYKNEIASLETALTGMGQETEQVAGSTAGFLANLSSTNIIIGAIVAAIIIAIAAFAALTIVMYKGISAASTYGNEIFKLEMATGLSAKTLSTLTVISKETEVSVDSLARTFLRTQAQVQKGLDEPFSAAGRAIRTLKLNSDELRKASPDQQVFMLAKAFTSLNNQNVKALVGQELFRQNSKDQVRLLEQIAEGWTVAQEKAKKYNLELDETGAVKSHMFTVEVADLKMAWDALWINLGIKILPQLTLLMEQFSLMILKTGGILDVFGKIANYELTGIRITLEAIKEIWDSGIFGAGGIGGLIMGGPSFFKHSGEVIAQQNRDQAVEYAKQAAELAKRGLQGDDQYARGKGAKSPMDRLEEQVKRLRFEIQALQEIGSKQFKLRFELEDLQKVKAGFESIFKLRTEMGLTLDQPVPKFRVFGTPEQQQQDLANIQSYVKQMERMKTVFEGVRKVANEQNDALAELARVQQEALMPVVDAGTLAAIKYATATRDRAKAEKELTADVISESKLRKDAVEDEVGATLKAYMTLQRDIGRSQDAIRDQRAQDEMFVRIVRGDLGTESDIRKGLTDRMGSIQTPIVPSELQTIAAHAATIDLNVASIAEKIGANVANVSNSNLRTSGSDNSYAGSHLVVRNPDGTVTVVNQQDSRDDTIKTQSNDPGFLRKRIFDESRQRAGGERATADKKANQDIIDNQMRMDQSLIALDTDYLDHYEAQQVARRLAARTTVVSIMLLENDLKDLENTNSDFYKRTWKEADEARLSGYRSLKISIITLQNDIANNGFDQADREKKAHLQAIRDVQEASNQARESIVYNQVKIADATIYHADIANAKVTEFLANQRSITQVIADAKVGVIDNTFSAIDSALDRFTSKLGLAGNLVKDLLSGFIRLALLPFFKSMYAPQGGGGLGGMIFGGGGSSSQGFGGGLGMGTSSTSLVTNAVRNLITSGGTGASGLVPPGMSSVTGLGGINLGHEGIHAAGAVAGGRFGNLLQGFGAIAPFLGASIGAGLGAAAGGQSGLGQILGGIGGLGIGGALGMAAFTALGGTVSPALAGIMAVAGPAALIIGPMLIAGAIILAKNKARQQEEKLRNQWGTDAQANILQLLAQAQTGDLTVAQAKIEWDKIGSAYMAQVATLKDSKTRRNATLWWQQVSGTAVDPGGKTIAIWPLIEAAARESEHRANIRARMSPVFASGGISRVSELIKVRPGEGFRYPGTNVIQTVFGRDLGYDSQYMYAPKGTRIYNQSEMRDGKGFNHGGTVGIDSNPSNDLPELHIDSLEFNLDPDGLATLVIKSRHFKTATVKNVKLAKKEKKLA